MNEITALENGGAPTTEASLPPAAVASVREICARLLTGSADSADLTVWVTALPSLAPGLHDGYLDELAFIALCAELVRAAADQVSLQLELVVALEQAAERVRWTGIVGRELAEMHRIVVEERVIPQLMQELAAERDPLKALSLYCHLEDFGAMEFDDAFYAVCSHPTLDLGVVVADLEGLLIEELPDPLLERIQREGREDLLDSLIPSYDAEPVLSRLRDRDRYAAGLVERAATMGALPPPWLFWQTDLLRRRPDIVRALFPWHQVVEYLDEALLDETYEYVHGLLSANQTARETFSALEPDFSGTLEELLLAAQEL
jgi:hypothetical protein